MAVTINGTTGIVTPDIGVDGTTLVVDAVNNRIGILQSSPTTTLDVNGTGNVSSRLNVGASSLDNRALSAYNTSTTVGAVSANNYNASGILFQGYNSSVDANNASFVVKSDGSTGIGTPSPTAPLHVLSSSYPTATIQRNHAVNYPRFRLTNTSNHGADLDGIGDGSPAGGFRVSTITSGTSTERLRIYGDGTTRIRGVNRNSPFTVSNTTGTVFILDDTEPSAVGTGGKIVFGSKYYTASNTMGTAFIGSYKENAPSNGSNEYDHSLIFGTNSSNGFSERLRIDSDGRLLIGTTSLIDGSTASNFQIASSSGPRLCIARNNTNVTGGNLMGALDFYGNDSDGNYEICGRILCEADGTHTTDVKPTRLTFYTTPTDDDVAEERFRIGSDGQSTFDKGAPGGANQVIARFQAESSRRLDIVWHDSGSYMGFDLPGSHDYIFKCAGSKRLRITSAGLFGIGHDSPTAYGRMTVAMPSQSGGAAIQVANSSNGSGDGTTSNVVLRSVNNAANQWADAEYRASQHWFSREGDVRLGVRQHYIRTGGGSQTSNNGFIPLTFYSSQTLGSGYRHGISTTFLGQISPGNSGNAYLHVKIDMPSGAMWWLHSWGYTYSGGQIHNSQAVGYVYNNNIIATSVLNENSNRALHVYRASDNNIVMRIYSAHGTSNAWGYFAFEGGFDGICGNKPDHTLRILAYTWTSSSSAQY